jgi:membrane associated rhomboid family serine protease
LIPIKDDIPTRRFPVLTVAIIVINVVMFFGFQGASLTGEVDDQKTIDYSVIPYEVAHPGQHCAVESNEIVCGKDVKDAAATWITVFTAMFMHGGLLHIAGNMLFLWIFGNNIEDAMGRLKFIGFYLGGGIVAALAQFAIDTNSVTPTLGASGAIAAVLGGYALLYPRARVVTLIFIIFFITVIELPALAVLGVWFLLQLLDAGSSTLGGGGATVAYFAHIGGFLFGLLAVKLLASRYDPDYDRHSRLPVY